MATSKPVSGGLRKYQDVHTDSPKRVCFSVRDEYNRQEIVKIFCDSPEQAIEIAKAKKMSPAPIVDLLASKHSREILNRIKTEGQRLETL